MDLLLFVRVLWGHKLVLFSGLVLAVALSTLSYVRIDIHDPTNLQYRQKQQWASYTTLFVTQQGFPWGSLGNQTGTTTTSANKTANSTPVDPARLISLAVIYSQLIPSDQVLSIMRQSGPINGTVIAAPAHRSGQHERRAAADQHRGPRPTRRRMRQRCPRARPRRSARI